MEPELEKQSRAKGLLQSSIQSVSLRVKILECDVKWRRKRKRDVDVPVCYALEMNHE